MHTNDADSPDYINVGHEIGPGANLRAAYLGAAYLGGADLGGADLRDAYLRGADLRDACLSGADLGGADLRGADLGDACLRGADLGGADLSGADLGGADLHGANLHGADLGGADLGGADLGGADLHGAYLHGAYLGGAHAIIDGGQDARGYRFVTVCHGNDGIRIAAGCRWLTASEALAHWGDDRETSAECYARVNLLIALAKSRDWAIEPATDPADSGDVCWEASEEDEKA